MQRDCRSVRSRVLIAPLIALALGGCYVSIGVDDDGFIGPGLDIRQPPQSQTVLVGQSASFAVDVVGVGPITYRWRRNGVDIPGATSFTYITPPATLADDGTLFTVRVCNDVMCLTSSPALLSVLPS